MSTAHGLRMGQRVTRLPKAGGAPSRVGRRTWRGPRLGRPDSVLVAAVLILLVMGLNLVYSASFVQAHNNPEYQSDSYFFVRQLLWVLAGIAGLIAAALIDYRRWQTWSLPLLGASFLLLILLLATDAGQSVNGAQRWLQLGPLPAIQPSELAKLALIVYLAAWLGNNKTRAASFKYGTVPFAIVTGAMGGLILTQPDLGSAFIVTGVGVAVFFLGGASIRHFLLGTPLLVGTLLAAILQVGYRVDRLQGFLNPASDPAGAGWHAMQNSIALGSGGIFGLGLGASRQKFYWLPAAHTDSIFAVLGEELGMIGCSILIGLFLLLCYRGIKIALSAPDRFGRLLAGGIAFWIAIQALINIAAVTGVLPFTGVPLPFVSAGGSSMIFSLIAIGILLNISRHASASRTRRPSP